MNRKQASKLSNFRLAARDPWGHAVKSSAQSIGRGQVALLDRQLEQLELRLEMNHGVTSASGNLDGVAPKLGSLLYVAFKRFDLAQENSRSRSDCISSQLGG